MKPFFKQILEDAKTRPEVPSGYAVGIVTVVSKRCRARNSVGVPIRYAKEIVGVSY